MTYLINAFLSGILFFIYLFVYSAWWVFAIIFMLLLSIFEVKDVNEMYMNDDREVM